MKLFRAKPPWYHAGLAFECQECGRCCAGPQAGYVWVTAEEIAAIAEYLGISDAAMRRKHARKVGRRFSLTECGQSNDCIFLAPRPTSGGHSSRGCRVYAVRPRQCRAWPFWPANLIGPDAWALAAVRCPGINRGRLFAREEIEERAHGVSR